MVKTVSAGMRTHLDGTVTSLTTIWRITRVDGVNLYFTDHDADIVYNDGDGAATYLAETGYNRTAVANKVGLNVDNMDVQGVFDDDSIKEDELRGGKFDYAEVKVSMVNWADLSLGAVKIRRGRLGEVIITPQGKFSAELRGLTQLLSQRIIEPYQAECRVDLGSSQCGIQIKPPVLTREQVVVAGEFYRVPTNVPAKYSWPNIILNPSFERATIGEPAAAPTDWDIITGDWRVASTFQGLSADDGTLFIAGGSDGATGLMRQIIDLELLGVNTVNIDAGDVDADFSCRRANSDVSDTGQVHVEFLDQDAVVISDLMDTGSETIFPLDTWESRVETGKVLPANTRFIRIDIIHNRVVTPESTSAFDNFVLTLDDNALSSTDQEIYENRIYEVLTGGVTAVAQPSYDTGIGNTTADGGLKASALLELTTNAVSSETVTINTQTYTWSDPLTDTADFVLVGATPEDSMDNLTAAINGGAGEGTLYGTGTVAHTGVNATDESGTIMKAEAKTAGTAQNLWDTTETMTAGSWDTDTLTGGTTIPILEAINAYMRHATVGDVFSFLTFEITVSEARAVDDWFNGGAVIFETGRNEGLVVEIKDWDLSSTTLTLFLPTAFQVSPGTKIRLYPGCDKRIAICLSKFANVINFRGEPYVPGPDAISKYPDAR